MADVKNLKLDVRVYPIDEPKGNTMAFASVSIEDLVAIRGIRVVDSEKGPFVAMPQSKDEKTGKHHDIAFPVAKGLRHEISKAILNEFEIQMDEKSADRKPGLNDRLKEGVAKSAERAPSPQTGARPKDAEVVA